ncbi:MAG: hypothetical protein ACLGSD_06110 [Acidobacteriota bacterium]
MSSLITLAEALRQTLRSIEQNTDLSPDDPVVLELKRILQQRIALFEVADATKPYVEFPTIGRKPPLGPD